MPIIKKIILGLYLIGWLSAISSFAQEQQSDAVLKYIARYKTIAMEEMKLYGIPASITLAQGILESNAGRSSLAVNGNNHFGIKCHNMWYGKTLIQDDDTKDECFRKYDTPEESFRDHSEFLKNRERYSFLFNYSPTDYKSWSYGLKQAGYATNPKYPELLIKNIDLYELYKYDNPSYQDSKTDIVADLITKPPVSGSNTDWAARIYLHNNIRTVKLLPGETLEDIGKKSKQGIRRILKYNDLIKNIRPADGSIIYLQPKRRTGNDLYHSVVAGETMYAISQLHGIKLKFLYRLNNMILGTEPEIGEIIYLRNRRTTTPKVRNTTISPIDPGNAPQAPKTMSTIQSTNNNMSLSSNTTPPPLIKDTLSDDTDNKAPDNLSSMITMPDEAINYYTVKSGDTLYSIAKAYNLSVEKLMQMNKLYSEIIHSGMRIRIRE